MTVYQTTVAKDLRYKTAKIIFHFEVRNGQMASDSVTHWTKCQAPILSMLLQKTPKIIYIFPTNMCIREKKHLDFGVVVIAKQVSDLSIKPGPLSRDII